MPLEESVTMWISRVGGKDEAAAQKLWERYFDRMVRLARRKLEGTPRRVADEEDVALSAFDSFCRGATRGRYPQMHDRDDLWKMLVVITVRKALDQVQHQRRLKRGGDRTVADDSPDEDALAQVLGREPTPELAASVTEECQRLLGLLDDDLRAIALRKMESYTDDEIAAQLGCARRTVQRKLRLIETTWAVEQEP